MIHGGEKAVSEFNLISGGEWFDEAPEYFLTTHIASSVKNLNSTKSLLEVSVGRSRKEAGASRCGRPAGHERRNGRFDVVVYWSNDKPRGAVEIKTPIWAATKKLIQPDIDELCAALKANADSTFQFCAFVYYASVAEPERKHDDANQKLTQLLDRIENMSDLLAKTHAIESIPIRGEIHLGNNDDGGAWCIASVVLTRKGGKQSFQ